MRNYKLHSKCVCVLVDEVTMASTILFEHLQQKMQSSFGGDDEQS